MTFENLTSISPIDGRYSDKTSPLKPIFSEFGLMKYRLLVEVRWLEALSKNSNIPEVPSFSPESNKKLLLFDFLGWVNNSVLFSIALFTNNLKIYLLILSL